ncbi:restriction endonuclease [Eggerthellaceae bacterium zg-997]|nr:restriction endonuclease [Eggerthellaceae bacterium zg-997]
MAGTIVDFFGYRAADDSDASLEAVAKNLCPFLHDTCTKTLGRDGSCSGVCAVKQVSSDRRIICCPIRLYADDYEILRIVSRKTFGVDLGLYSGRAAVGKARSEGGAVAVFGHRWGGELRLPKRNGVGNYFADWVLARLDERGELAEFTSIEVQTIDTTGNYRASRAGLIDGRREVKSTVGLNWENVSKRIIPQLVYKGQVLQREPLCRSGLWFVTPESVYSRIIDRLGGAKNMAFGYAPQPGALHFLRYDYDDNAEHAKGVPTKLMVTGDECTTVEQVQAAFNRVRLPEPGVYGKALREALYG